MKKIFSNRFVSNPATEDPARLKVEIAGGSPIPLPVAIRTSELSLVGYCKTATTITLDPGLYVVQLKRPDGSEQNQVVELNRGDDKTIQMEVSRKTQPHAGIRRRAITLAAKSPTRMRVVSRPNEQVVLAIPGQKEFNRLKDSFAAIKLNLAKNVGYTGSSNYNPDHDLVFGNIETSGSGVSDGYVRSAIPHGCLARVLVYEDSGWKVAEKGLDQVVSATETIDRLSRITLKFRADSRLQVMEVRKAQSDSIFLVLPLYPNSQIDECTVELWDYEQELKVTCDFSQFPRSSLMLEYLAAGSYDFAVELVKDAEAMLFQKISNPIEAALGGYVLLRLGDLEHLHDWPTNLCNWFTGLADGAIIAAELAAKKNRHTEALDLFLEAGRRGLPLFKEGLSVLVSRLREYALNPEEFGFDETKSGQALASYKHFAELALFSDASQQLLSFKGISLLQEDTNQHGWQYIVPDEVRQQGIDLKTLPVFIQGEADV